jgi:hypothetical protein
LSLSNRRVPFLQLLPNHLGLKGPDHPDSWALVTAHLLSRMNHSHSSPSYPADFPRRGFLALTAKSAAALLLLRSASSAGAAPSDKTALTWFMWGNTDPEVDLWKEIAALAQKQVPNLQIDLSTAVGTTIGPN